MNAFVFLAGNFRSHALYPFPGLRNQPGDYIAKSRGIGADGQAVSQKLLDVVLEGDISFRIQSQEKLFPERLTLFFDFIHNNLDDRSIFGWRGVTVGPQRFKRRIAITNLPQASAQPTELFTERFHCFAIRQGAEQFQRSPHFPHGYAHSVQVFGVLAAPRAGFMGNEDVVLVAKYPRDILGDPAGRIQLHIPRCRVNRFNRHLAISTSSKGGGHWRNTPQCVPVS